MSVEFSRPVIAGAGPVWAFVGPRNWEAVAQLRMPFFSADGLLSSVNLPVANARFMANRFLGLVRESVLARHDPPNTVVDGLVQRSELDAATCVLSTRGLQVTYADTPYCAGLINQVPRGKLL